MITIEKNKKLYKTVSYPCGSILEYMNLYKTEPCRTNKMLWLSEDKERALSYGSSLKIFTATADFDLWNLLGNEYPFQLKKYDVEFRGKMDNIMNIFGPGNLSIKSTALYDFLTGSGLTAKKQLATLKSIYSEINENTELVFDSKTTAQTIMTPDSKSFEGVIEEYIKIGEELDEDQLATTNQRLSIYGLDQILLKMMCLNENSGIKKGIKGWIVPSGTQTVWTEFVDKVKVSDMGEIAVFDCSNLIICGEMGGRHKKSRKKKNKSRKKKNKSRKKKNKSRQKKGNSNNTRKNTYRKMRY